MNYGDMISVTNFLIENLNACSISKSNISRTHMKANLWRSRKKNCTHWLINVNNSPYERGAGRVNVTYVSIMMKIQRGKSKWIYCQWLISCFGLILISRRMKLIYLLTELFFCLKLFPISIRYCVDYRTRRKESVYCMPLTVIIQRTDSTAINIMPILNLSSLHLLPCRMKNSYQHNPCSLLSFVTILKKIGDTTLGVYRKWLGIIIGL